MKRYVVDASFVIKWFIPEIHSESAARLQHIVDGLHVPAFFMLELGNVLCKKIRRTELTPDEAETILRGPPDPASAPLRQSSISASLCLGAGDATQSL